MVNAPGRLGRGFCKGGGIGRRIGPEVKDSTTSKALRPGSIPGPCTGFSGSGFITVLKEKDKQL